MKPWHWLTGCALIAASIIVFALCQRFEVRSSADTIINTDRLTGRTWVLMGFAHQNVYWRQLGAE